MKKLAILGAVAMFGIAAHAQNDVSLFWKKDSVQVEKIVSESGNEYKTVGHHGPAVENQYMILRIYYNHSGAIDIYSKATPEAELMKYLWYPTKEQIIAGAGCDEYKVGKTTGLGGISLWDGEKEVKLVATKGREASVKKLKKGAQIEMLAKGVEYKGEHVDIAIRVIVCDKKRTAKVEAECVSGQKVQFMTGANFHDGQEMKYSDGRIAVWGLHPADVVDKPLPVGSGMKYCKKQWGKVEKTKDMLRITSKPSKKASTIIVGACSREAEINTQEKFFNYVEKL